MFRIPLTAAAVTLVVASAAAAAPPGPLDTVKAVYAADAPYRNNTGPGVMGDDKLRARFFSGALLAGLKKDEDRAAKANEPPTIEGDPFIDEQEPDARDFKFSLVSQKGNGAKVLVNFDRGDKTREDVTYSMVLEGGAWRIDDIGYKYADGSTDSMRKTLGMK
ncbi:MAG TPA: DUF3828 domain-containing protein [Rhizomicrobium sp.]|nr:DUF3828 domain-containing protein [Rhizomicrobium sp.]